jgi:glycerol-3-phosphate dehydrogenase
MDDRIQEEITEETIQRFYTALLPLPGDPQDALERQGFRVDVRSIRRKNGTISVAYMTRRYAFETYDVVVHVVGGKITPTGRGNQSPRIDKLVAIRNPKLS